MEVKINKYNNQKYVTIPKNSKLNEGDKVKIDKVNYQSKEFIKNYYNKNKSTLLELSNKLKEQFCDYKIHPTYLATEYVRKKYKIEENEGQDFTLNDVWVSVTNFEDLEIYDSENYVDFDRFQYDDTEIFKEDEIGYTFNKEYFEERIKNFEDSQKIYCYLKMEQGLNKLFNNMESEILEEFGFTFFDWGGNQGLKDEFNVWYNEENNVYLFVPIMWFAKEEISLTSMQGYDSSFEIEIWNGRMFENNKEIKP